jgi:hypothetical protein
MKVLNFTQPLNVPIKSHNRKYRLEKDWQCYWEEKGVRYKLNILEGFEYDGASVPRILWSISDLTPDGVIRGPATLHDKIYDSKGRMGSNLYHFKDGNWRECDRVFTRKDADDLFHAFMKPAGVKDRTRGVAYWAVRLFGWVAWRKK